MICRYYKYFLAIIKNIKWHRFGRCTICGKFTIFFCKYDNGSYARETMNCLFCRSTSRKRHVALAVILNSDIKKSKTIKYLGKNTKLDIYNTEANIWMNYFKKGNYITSIYSENNKNGTKVNIDKYGMVYCQNLEMLTFNDESFDIIITEDVLEHVRNHKFALSEIYRVLKKGGVHIFTIPFLQDRRTIVRIDTSTEKDIHILPPEYHGDDIRKKIITYRTFGIDIFDVLSTIGFNTTILDTTLNDSQFGIYNSLVFISKK